jgi:hypothetical protein
MRPRPWIRDTLEWFRRKRPFPYPVSVKAGALALLWLVGGLYRWWPPSFRTLQECT